MRFWFPINHLPLGEGRSQSYTHNNYILYQIIYIYIYVSGKVLPDDVPKKRKLAAFVAQGAVWSRSDSKHLWVFLVRSCVEICWDECLSTQSANCTYIACEPSLNQQAPSHPHQPNESSKNLQNSQSPIPHPTHIQPSGFSSPSTSVCGSTTKTFLPHRRAAATAISWKLSALPRAKVMDPKATQMGASFRKVSSGPGVFGHPWNHWDLNGFLMVVCFCRWEFFKNSVVYEENVNKQKT